MLKKIRLLQCREKIFNLIKISVSAVFIIVVLNIFPACSDRSDEDYYLSPAPAPEAVQASGVLSRSSDIMKSVQTEDAPETAELPAERKKTFSAGCTVQTASPAGAVMEVSEIAENHGGWIESSDSNTAVIRVAVSELQAVFEKILALGRVVEKYVESEDVTDRYTDLETRLKVLTASKARLEALLAAETGAEEKIKIFREIKRVDDQIESLKISLESIDRDIEYSVIRASFIPYNIYEDKNDIPFRWIRDLDPFNASINNVYRKIVIPLPDDYAVIKEKRYFHAETPDGTVLRIGTADNKPFGDNDFWQKALEYHLKGFFRKSEQLRAGDVHGVVFTGKDDGGFKYFAGVFLIRKLIFVVEIYFPDSLTFETRSKDLFDALERLVIK